LDDTRGSASTIADDIFGGNSHLMLHLSIFLVRFYKFWTIYSLILTAENYLSLQKNTFPRSSLENTNWSTESLAIVCKLVHQQQNLVFK
jgi:hypothetical protein